MSALRRHWLSSSVLTIGLAILVVAPVQAQTSPVTVSVEAVQLSITVSPGSVSFGPVELGGFKTTQTNPPSGPAVVGQTQTVTNASSVGVILKAQYVELDAGVYGANCDATATTAEWTPVIPTFPVPPAPPGPGVTGPEQFALEAGNVNNDNSRGILSPGGFPSGFAPFGSESVIPAGASSDLDFGIFVPTITTQTSPCTVPVIIIATVGS